MDAFEHQGWTVEWSGWRLPTNQILKFGFWFAHRAEVEGVWYATTMGAVGFAEPTECLDTSLYDDWPHPVLFLADDEFDRMKELARLRLLKTADFNASL